MKKIIGIIAGLIVAVVLVVVILFTTGVIGEKANAPIEDSVFEQYYDNYVTKLSTHNDIEIYDNLLDDSLRKRFTLEQISQMNDYLRGFGEIKKVEDIKIKESTKNNKNIYEVSSRIVYERAPQLVKLEMIKKGKNFKIINFSYTNEF